MAAGRDVAEFWFVSGPQSLSREDLLTLVGMQERTIAELKAWVTELERSGSARVASSRRSSQHST